MRLAFAVFLACALGAKADPIAVTATPLSGLRTGDFGPLMWRGGLELESADAEFGGLSGLALSPDCKSLLAVSDTGRWFKAALRYDGETLSGVEKTELAPMLDARGRPFKGKVRSDAEAIASVGPGRYLVGFESRPRVGIYDVGKSGFKARLQALKSPKGIAQGPRNAELESVGQIASGPWTDYHFVISESNLDDNGNIRGWLWQGAKTVSFAVKRLGDYAITDAAILEGGDILILERSFSGLFPGMSVRRFPAAAITAGAAVDPTPIFEGSATTHAIDNMEGIALCKFGDETRVTIVSDNNFNTRLQRTLLLQFAYKP